ncbi:hypothetical protein [Amaricoccus sp.]|uniref:hypothetical protein n=1 Tax=Amaricoccus sp. TaxID=1872485 RepID=UPI001B46E44F|nr:hypothetical protein [Amaricoccus sp.]MBP7242296.1 hypothetical protein [Amaricoccus sp.]
MQDATEASRTMRAIVDDAAEGEAFAAIADPEHGEGRETLLAIARKIGRFDPDRDPTLTSAIPAGVTYLTQFAAHDLDLRGREDVDGRPMLDLALIYGDGPRHDPFAYQVPQGPGEPRHLLRIGRARPAWNSPAWGAARDLPRASCPHLDAHGIEARSEVLIPNTFSDSNLILGQVQTLWALLHNAVASGLVERGMRPEPAFETARRVTRHVYRSALINDVIGSWIMPRLRTRYVAAEPQLAARDGLARLPRAFMTGVARIGHALVRETYALNDQRGFEGLRSLIRHNSACRPADMPLTEDWLLDFGRFFDLGDGRVQHARAIGPHLARPFALGGGVRLDHPTPSDGLVLRDLVACTRAAAAAEGTMPSVRTLVARIEAAAPGLLDGSFAQDAVRRRTRLAKWLEDVPMPAGRRAALAEDPPLTLFLMIEAMVDSAGAHLGAVGSALMAETIGAALPDPASAEDIALARDAAFHGPAPERMTDLVRFLQRHYRFPDGARLHRAEPASPAPASSKRKPSETRMLDDQNAAQSSRLFEVADYIELGKLVADWTQNEASRPKCIDELRRQLDGIAKVPDNFKDVDFVEGRSDVLVIRLPEKDLMAEAQRELEGASPMTQPPYRLPKFYDDIYHRHFGPEMTSLDIFLARMGDYTIARCQ